MLHARRPVAERDMQCHGHQELPDMGRSRPFDDERRALTRDSLADDQLSAAGRFCSRDGDCSGGRIVGCSRIFDGIGLRIHILNDFRIFCELSGRSLRNGIGFSCSFPLIGFRCNRHN